LNLFAFHFRFGGRKMHAPGVALIVIGLALVCGGLIFRRGSAKSDEKSSQAGGSGEIPQIKDRAYAETLRRLNAIEPEMRNEGGEDHRPRGETDRSVP